MWEYDTAASFHTRYIIMSFRHPSPSIQKVIIVIYKMTLKQSKVAIWKAEDWFLVWLSVKKLWAH